MNNPTLSVLMPNYNHAKYIGKAIEDILSQSYRPSEIIIIDDASTDNSVEIIQQFAERYPLIRPIRNEKNMGVIYSMNKLLELAKGDYVYMPSADDRILPVFFEKSMNLLLRYPQAGLCSALTLIIDEEGRNKGLHPSLIISKEECFITPEKSRSILERAGAWIIGNSTILKRKALIDSGGFIPELHSFTDGFIYQVIALKYGVCFIPEPLVCWRRMDSGYAMSTGVKPDIVKEITCNAVLLMRTTYRDLFSEEYIYDFERVQFFLTKLNLLSFVHKEKMNFMGNNLSHKPVLKNLILFINHLLLELKKIIYVLYLFIRFRPKIFPVIIRKINKYLYLQKFYSSRKISVK